MTSHTSAPTPRFELTLAALPALAELAQDWRQLETTAQPSFFTSWSWIGCWLETLPATVRPQLLRARQGGRTVGLALLVRQPRQRFGLPFCDSWHLHATGDATFDILTIEHNGFLLDATQAEPVRTAMLAHWMQHSRGASELLLSGQAGSGLPAGTAPKLMRDDWVRTSYGVDLAAVREKKGDYLALLSSNTRSQIRRSIKEYEKLGPLTLTAATDVAEAKQFLSRLADLHQRHWVERGEPGAFSNPYFQRFHERLIELNLARGEIQLLRITVGERELAYLYSFVLGGRVYFYQSGFDYELIEKHSRPGLVAHVLGAQHNAALGYMVYDFMAGDSRYKLNLATLNEPMTWTTLRKPAWRFQLEQALRERRRRQRESQTSATAVEVAEAD
jgi:CelD/BcsL family acetyltransferase involved in cellulose biosynthesis